jgi:DNA-binding transcriptional ArsR family regulator
MDFGIAAPEHDLVLLILPTRPGGGEEIRLDLLKFDLIYVESLCIKPPAPRPGAPADPREARRMTRSTPVSDPPDVDYVVDVFRALADPVRLRIMGLLVEEERCGQELAEMLRISPGTVSHHLQMLKRLGLLTEERRAPYTYVRLDYPRLREAVVPFLKKERVQQFSAGPDVDREKRKVLEAFFEGPRLKSIPAQRRKKEIVFEEILRRLPDRKSFREETLSRLLEDIHPDFCTIRREFIMGRYMERTDGVYRWTDKGNAVREAARSR